MTLRNRLLATAAPIVVVVAWDTLCLGARVLGLYRTFEENAATFNPAVAMDHLMVAIQDYIDHADDEQAA